MNRLLSVPSLSWLCNIFQIYRSSTAKHVLLQYTLKTLLQKGQSIYWNETPQPFFFKIAPNNAALWQILAHNNSLKFRPFSASEYSLEVHRATYICKASSESGTILSRIVNVKAGKTIHSIKFFHDFFFTFSLEKKLKIRQIIVWNKWNNIEKN